MRPWTVRNPEEGECPALEAVTRNLVKTQQDKKIEVCALVTCKAWKGYNYLCSRICKNKVNPIIIRTPYIDIQSHGIRQYRIRVLGVRLRLI